MNKITLLMAIVMIAFTVKSYGQEGSAFGDSSATIVEPIAITKGNALVFGSIVPDGGGTIKIATDGTVTPTGPRLLNNTTTSVASFNVTGEIGAAFQVTLPSSISLSDGDATAPTTMTVDVLEHNHVQTATLADSDANGSGDAIFNVGGTLNVASGQKAGSYAGTYEVKVQYL